MPSSTRLALGVLSALALLVLTPVTGGAQELSCLTATPGQDVLLGLSLASPYPDRAASALIDVYVHVLRRSDGSGGLLSAEVAALLTQLAADFAPSQIRFSPAAESTLDNTTWYDDPVGHAATLFTTDAHADALDLYLGPPSGTVAGKAAGIPSTALVLAGDATDTPALSHLVGHCLGLYDTEETAFGTELPDGSNKGMAGDLVGDTAADPGLSGYVAADCSLTAQFAIDHPDHDPDPGNLMGAGRMSCWTGFTAEQSARMLAVLDHVSALREVRTDPAVVYTDRSSLTGLEYDDQPSGAAALDYNHDGKKDLLISRWAYASMAWACTGYDGTTGTPAFQGDGNAFPSPPASGTLGFILADYDNDGWTDFYAPNPAGGQLYRNVSGTFTDVTSASGLPASGYGLSHGASWGDYDADGDVDLRGVWGADDECGEQGGLRLYRNDVADSGTFADVTTAAGLDEWPLAHLSALWGDLDIDGDLDLLLLDSAIQYTGPPQESYTRYFANDGDGTFTDVTSERIDFPDEVINGTVCALTDLDNDGDLDVAWYDWFLVGYFENEGGDLTYLPLASSNVIPRDLTTFDFDLDGAQDLLVAGETSGSSTGYPLLLANRQGALIDESSLVGFTPGAPLFGLGLADYNHDGFGDLYASRTDAGGFFYKAAPRAGEQQREWTGVRLVSEDGANNYLGLGTTVIVTAGSLVTAQIADGGSGKASQHEPNLVLGLGDWTGTVTAEVRWSTGRVQAVTLQRGQYNTVHDDSPVVDDGSVSAGLIYHVDTGEQDWVFEWTTSHAVTASLDKVRILTDGLSEACIPAQTLLTPSLSGVQHTVTQQQDGTYLHQLIWLSVDCVPRCNIPFEVESGIDQFTSKSRQNHRLNVTSCLQSQ